MGQATDAYKRLDDANEHFFDLLVDIITRTLPDDVDADSSYLEGLSYLPAGYSLDDYYEVLNSLERVAKAADSGELAQKLKREYGDE